MKPWILTALLLASLSLRFRGEEPSGSTGSGRVSATRSSAPEDVAKAADGTAIPHPASMKVYAVTDGPRTISVPVGMVYVPAGEFTFGAGPGAKQVRLEAYCIGKYSVTNAEYKAFLDANRSARPPNYWQGGAYPAGKENHPVVYVSLTQANAYADWVKEQTGWKIAIPSSEQWEKAARGPRGFLYPWGNNSEVGYQEGVLTTKFNFNAVTAADYLKNHAKMEVTYNNRNSKYLGKKTTVDQIAGYDDAGNATTLSVSPNGGVRGWVSHSTYTGFIYTDLFTTLNAQGGNTSAVGAYEAGKSAYGAYDMAGNVWNWCDTKITATNGAEKGQTVNEIRGGSWYATGNSCKSISIGEGRSGNGAYNTVGFRIVRIP
jgi:formylglycine-generating enzyme required for sulfatase activity